MQETCSTICERLTTLTVPTPPTAEEKGLYAVLGVLNCFLFGVGMIILGIIRNDVPDIVIGLIQILLFCLGWIWAILWGVLIVIRALN